MAVNFMGQNFGGYDYFPSQSLEETEEERRRRLALEEEARTPVKQTITYDPVTGAQKVKIEGSALNLSQANPATPTVAAPVAPEDIYGRMVQAESGGRQVGANGQVLTSPKGALGVGQVMPATAMQPGYGVTNIFDLAQQRGMQVPARDEATARQLLGNEQLNREFGQNYYNAMNQRFGTQGGVAAYNAGPGRVQENMAANAGQLNTSQLPNETQAYIQKVLGKIPGQPATAPVQAQAPAETAQPIINDQGQVIGRETPSQMVAGAQTNAPVAPVAPGAVQTTPVAMTQPPQAQVEQAGPSTALMTPEGWAERLNTARQDDRQLASLAYDPNTPQYVREQASADLYGRLRNAQLEAQAKSKLEGAVAKGDLTEVNREMKKSTPEGSWLKYLFYGFIDPNMAKNERLKLFPEEGSKMVSFTSPDGKTTGIMRVAYDGTPMSGKTSDGKTLTENQLVEYYPGTTGKLDLVGGTYVSDTLKDKAGNALVGRVVTNKDTGQSYIQTDEGRKPMAGFRPQTSTGSLTDMRARTIQELNLKLQGKTAEEKMAILRPYNQQLAGQGYQPISADEVGLSAPQIGGQASVPQPGQPAPGQAPLSNAARPTSTEISAGKTQAEETGRLTGKAAGEVAGKDIKNQAFADSSYSLIKPISDAIKESTGSTLGSGVDTVAGAIGKSTKGAQAIAKLDVLGYSLVSNVPRFEGPQGVRDVELYERAAGDLANSKKPIETRLAALDAVITLLKKYDKEGKNDWTFSSEGKPSGMVIIKREKI